jgi:sortase A
MRALKNWKQLLSAVLMICGAFLLGRAAREIFDSYWGQTQATKHFETSLRSQPSRRSPAVPTHRRFQPGDTVAKLSIPRLGADIYVVEGTDAKDLRLGPGHMPGTALPGEKGNCVIAGHRDTHFRVLRNIRPGDEITLETTEGRFVYTVDGTQIVRPTNVSSLQPAKSGVLHLITCYPFYYLGNAPKRFIVEAKLEPGLSEAKLESTPSAYAVPPHANAAN